METNGIILQICQYYSSKLKFLAACSACLLIFAAPAFAQGGPPDNRPPDNRPPGQGNDGQGDSTAISSAESTSEASAQVTVNITPDNSVSSQAAPTSNTLTVNEAQQPDKITIKNTPTAIAPDIMPTVSCFRAASGSIAVPGFGASGAAGKIDQDCVKREYIRLAYAMGAHARALWMWCQQPAVWTDFGSREACLQFEAQEIEPVATAAPPPPQQQYVTEQRLEEADTEIMQQVEPLQAQVQRIEDQLNASARAQARAQAEREAWKQELATRYLQKDEDPDGTGNQ